MNTNILKWALKIIAAIILLQTLYFKFTGAPESVYIFTTLGIEPWGRIGSGVAELIASILLFIPRTTWLGAGLALGTMLGAIGSHLVKLGIEVQGDGVEERKNALRDIRLELNRIHDRSFPMLRVFQKIPCTCYHCIAADLPHEFDVADLRNRTKATIECPKSSVDIPVRQLLEGFFAEEGRQLLEKKRADGPKKIFFSYSKHDRSSLEQLLKHLAPLRINQKIHPWNDADILPGDDWNDTIRRELAEADIIILLVSSDFLATPYIQSVEIKSAMERHEKGDARVIPVILRSCDWQDMPFGILNGLPFKGQPVSKWSDLDDAWLAVVHGIKKIVEEFTA